MPVLAAGSLGIHLSDDLNDLVRPRCLTEPFVVETLPSLWIERVSEPAPEEKPLEGSPASWGFSYWEGSCLKIRIPDEPLAVESALRLAYHRAFGQQSCVLIHSSSVAFGTGAIVAVGPSGSGKTTLGRLCVESGHGQLMSDEMTAVKVDGTVYGTPFRSDGTGPGSLGPKKLKAFLLLQKASKEGIEKTMFAEGLKTLATQLFESEGGDFRQRWNWLSSAAEHSGIFKLSFRKNCAVGEFLAGWV